MKQIIALVLLFTWMLLIIIMMGEPQMNDQVNESVGSGPQWIGQTLAAFILFTPFIVIKLMDGKTKQAKHNTYIHGIKIMNMKQKITKPTVPTFKVNDRVQFYLETNDRGMSMYSGTEYGIITKMNKVTVVVKTKTDEWKLSIDKLHQYVDPFSGWAE